MNSSVINGRYHEDTYAAMSSMLATHTLDELIVHASMLAPLMERAGRPTDAADIRISVAAVRQHPESRTAQERLAFEILWCKTRIGL